MKYLKFFEKFASHETFLDTEPCDLVCMSLEEIISLISNTFDSEVIESDPDWTIIKCKWKILEKDAEMTKLSMKDIIDLEEDIYFHIGSENYVIVRGESDKLESFLKKAQSINSAIKVDGGTEGKSLILKGRQFYRIFYSLRPIPKGQDHVMSDDDEFYDLKSMGCSGDLRLNDQNISYYSDLMIGSDFSLIASLNKEYPGLTKTQQLIKSAEERSKPVLEPKILKGEKNSGIFKKPPDYNSYKNHLVPFSYEDFILEACDGLKKYGDNNIDFSVYYFEKPKHFDKMKFNIHEYDPADVYYFMRISEIQNIDSESETFVFQWIGKLFANEEHLQNHYKRYPHFGPGGKNHTYIRPDGSEGLNYQPPMYKGVESLFGYNGDTIGEFYYCTDRDALFSLVEQFNDFVKDGSRSHFETDYPNYKI